MEPSGVREYGTGPWVVVALGAALLAGFLVNFWYELGNVTGRVFPVLAVTLGVTLSLAVGYAGLHLRAAGLGPRANRRVAGWTLAGVAVGRYAARATHEAREARRARDAFEFINGMLRHELLNGVNVIRAYADELARRTDGGEQEAAADVEAIRGPANHLADLVCTIRPAAEAFASERSIEPVDLGAVLRDRFETTRAARPSVELEADIDPGVHVEANEALDNVFANLLNNAIEHNDTPDPRVTVTVEADERTATVRVGDDGPGVPDDRKEAVFEPRTGSDHGFGLYLVRTLVASYG
ncbi:MAG: HAMP domain-containing sensor histidine kinase [Haloarculaceae archaeon]